MSQLLFPAALDKQKLDKDRILFIGAERDYIVPANEVKRSAKRLGCQYKIYDGMSHTYQAERDWEIVARDALNWLLSIENS